MAMYFVKLRNPRNWASLKKYYNSIHKISEIIVSIVYFQMKWFVIFPITSDIVLQANALFSERSFSRERKSTTENGTSLNAISLIVSIVPIVSSNPSSLLLRHSRDKLFTLHCVSFHPISRICFRKEIKRMCMWRM